MVTLDDMQARSGALAAAKATKRSRYRWTILLMLGVCTENLIRQ